MTLNKDTLLKCRGEDGAKPIKEILAAMIDETNVHDTRTQHITADENGTHFTNGVYVNGNEMVANDEYPDPSSTDTQVNNLESEESNSENN